MNLENKKQLLIIALAIGAGIFAAALIAKWMENNIQNETRRLAVQFEEKQKIRSKRQQEQMAALNNKIDNVQAQQQQALKQATEALKKQQAMLAAKKEEETKKPKPSLALRTPSGKRAITVSMKSLGAVGGLINPGDFVDVIANLNVPSSVEGVKKGKGSAAKTVTVMVFQNLQILAINTNLEDMGMYDDQQAMAALKLTFAVDPQEAGLLSFAEKNGGLELALRSPRENSKRMTQASTWETLAEYVLENQGSDINLPQEIIEEEEEVIVEEAPDFRIFRGGREL